MEPENPRKREKSVGYALLITGLIVIVVGVILAIMVLLSFIHVPQFVPLQTNGQDALANALIDFSNVCLIFFLLVIVIWGGSVISSRGVNMIKDVRLKLAARSVREVGKTVEKIEEEKP